jgi:surfeit locus 1 family protein
VTGRASPTGGRFEIVPAIAVAIGIAILIGLGVWQVQRLHWKEAILLRVAALQAAPPQPLEPLLARAESGEDVDYHRVEMTCPKLETSPYLRLYAVWRGYGGYRLIAACPVAAGPYRAILVDRGFIAQGLTPAAGQPLAGPVVGVLRKGDAPNFVTPANQPGQNLWYWRDIPAMAAALGASEPAPSFLMLERPAPPAAGGPTPAAIPADIPNNHLQYAITWFGLAAALAGVYLGGLWSKRRRG